MTKQKRRYRLTAMLIIGSCVGLTGCGSKHIRKTDTYGIASRKHQMDEAEVAKNLGVSYPVYSQESKVIAQYRQYQAKQGKGMVSNYDIWLIARKHNMLPSQYLERVITITPTKP